MFTLIGAILAVIITALELFTTATDADPVRVALWAGLLIGGGIVTDWVVGKVRA